MLKYFLKSCVVISLSLFLLVGNAWAGIVFDGTDDYVYFAGSNGDGIFDQATALFTIIVWIKSTNTGVLQYITDCDDESGHAGGTDYYRIYIDTNDKAVFKFAVGGNPEFIATATSTTDVIDGTWHQIVGQRSATKTAKIFVDSVEEGTETYTGALSGCDTDSDFYVGTKRTLASFFNGEITDVSFWRTTALTQTEITLLFQAKLKLMPLNIQLATLVNYTPMNDQEVGTSADTDTIRDLSTKANNGTGVDGANNTGLTWAAETVLNYPSGIISG